MKYELLRDCLDAKAGDIFEYSESGDCYSKIDGDTEIDYTTREFVETHPDWFRPVKDVEEYEILKCLQYNGKGIHPYQKGKCLGDDKTVLACSIYSVKRISDGQIIELNKTHVQDLNTGHDWIVSELTVKDTRCFANGVNICEKYLKIIPLPPVRTPLFKTFDGKDVFDGDKVFHFCTLEGSWKITETIARSAISQVPCYFKYFLTEEEAKLWILENKPCLSLNDLLSVWGNDYCFKKDQYKDAPLFKNFESLAKSKLKL